MKLLRRWTSEAIYRTWKAGADAFFWYSLRDRAKGDGNWSDSDQSGLYFRAISFADDRPKPILQAYRFPFVAFADGRKGFHFWGRTPYGTRKPVVIKLNTGGKWRRLRTVRVDPSSGIFHGYIRARAGKLKRGLVSAEIPSSLSVPFSLKRVRDRPARPFG